jgi:hypothetical protein
MSNWRRTGVVVAVALGACAGLPSARADFDAEPTPMADGEVVQIVVDDMSEPRAPLEPGAGSMEPFDAVKEDLGAVSHRAWVESIWSTP